MILPEDEQLCGQSKAEIIKRAIPMKYHKVMKDWQEWKNRLIAPRELLATTPRQEQCCYGNDDPTQRRIVGISGLAQRPPRQRLPSSLVIENPRRCTCQPDLYMTRRGFPINASDF